MKTIKNTAALFLGAAVLAFGLFNIHSFSGITEGGILGTTLLLHHHFGISPGYSEFILDMLIYLAGFSILGRGFLFKALISASAFSLSYGFFEFTGPVLPDLSAKPLIAAILGGLFVGVGAGLVVKSGGACGGDDALALLLNKFTGLSLAGCYFIFDAVILLLSLSYIPFDRIIYSFITVTISSFIIDRQHKSKSEAEENLSPDFEY